MKASRFLIALVAVVGLARGAAAQAPEVDASKLYLGSAPCTFSTGSGAPTGGVVCDVYVNYATGAIYSKTLGGGWLLVNSGGTVTSVGLAMPGQFTVTGSPVTTSGTLTAGWTAQAANVGLFGPTTGSAAAPTFRALVKADQVAVTAYTDAANIFLADQTITKDHPQLNLRRTATSQYATLNFTTNATDEWNLHLANTATPVLRFSSALAGGTTVLELEQNGAARLPRSLATPIVYGAGVAKTLTLGGTGGGCSTNPPTQANCEALAWTIDTAFIEQRLKTDPSFRGRWFVGTDGAHVEAFNGGGWMPLKLNAGPTQIGGGGLHVGSLAGTVDPGLGNALVDGYLHSTSPAYTSQTTGMALDFTDGSIDARYIFTNELHAKSFIADLEQALAGGQIIAKSVGVLGAAFTAPAAGGTAVLTMKDLPSAENMAIFEAGDYLRIRQFDRSGGQLSIADAWGTVSGYADQADKLQTWTFTRLASNSGAMSTGAVIGADAIVLDYGVSGNGFLESNAIDGLRGINSPYHQVVTWAGASPYAGNQTVRTRLGNLRGITGTPGEYGLIAGAYAATNGQYLKASSLGVELHGVDLSLWSGATRVMRLDPGTPYQSMGTPAPTAFLGGPGCWSGLDAGVFKWRCGAVGGQSIAWDGLTLSVQGTVSVTGGNAATTTAVSAAEAAAIAAAYADATTKANAAQAAALSGASADATAKANAVAIASLDKLTYVDTTTIKGGMITTGSVTAAQIAANAITASKILAGAVTADKITVTDLVTLGATIGGWTITSDSISSGSGSTAAGISTAGTVRFWAGDSTPANGQFRVSNTGALVATNASLTGASGTVTINSNGIFIAVPPTATDDLYAYRFSTAFTGTNINGLHAYESSPNRYLSLTNSTTAASGQTFVLLKAASNYGNARLELSSGAGAQDALLVGATVTLNGAMALQGATTATGRVTVQTGTDGPLHLNYTGGTDPNTAAAFYRSGTLQGSITTAAGTTAYNTTSDRRLKIDIRPTVYGLADLLNIDVSDFAFVHDPARRRHSGFVAQQLYGVYPEAVFAPADGVWQVDYAKLTPLLVRAVQELTARVAALEKDPRQ